MSDVVVVSVVVAAVVGILGVATPGDERMSDRQLEAFAEMTRSVNAGEAQAYARLYAPDAVITFHGSGVLEGRSAIEEHERELLREFPAHASAFMPCGRKGRWPSSTMPSTGETPGGQAMGHEGLLFYRFHPSGLIAGGAPLPRQPDPDGAARRSGAVAARPLPAAAERNEGYVAQLGQEIRNVAVVTATLAALDAKNEAAFVSALAPDVVMDEMTETKALVGPADVKAWFETWTRAIPDARSEIATIMAIGDFVLAEMVLAGTLKGPLAASRPPVGASPSIAAPFSR